MIKKIAPAYILSLLLLLHYSCSSAKRKSQINRLSVTKSRYALSDKSGKFIVYREVGYVRKTNNFIVKRKVYSDNDNKKKVLETSVTISTLGKIRGRPYLRPKISQFSVWFEGQKYFTELKVNIENKSLDVKLNSPEKKWNGIKSIPFPKTTSMYCFFSQIIECASINLFIEKATESDSGKIDFFVIWDGYPYFHEQYVNIPADIFAPAVLEFDGKNRHGERRFTLRVAGQSIFYFVDKKEKLEKMFWVSQGLSFLKK